MNLTINFVSENLLPALGVATVDYAGVMLAVVADLLSGVMKARHSGRPRTSRGYRRTVTKASRYYNLLIALTVLDAMLIASVLCLRQSGWSLPVFPLFTTVGALGMAMIEVKSILERNEDKGDLADALETLRRIFSEVRPRK